MTGWDPRRVPLWAAIRRRSGRAPGGDRPGRPLRGENRRPQDVDTPWLTEVLSDGVLDGGPWGDWAPAGRRGQTTATAASTGSETGFEMPAARGSPWEVDEVRATIRAYFDTWRRASPKAEVYRELAAQFPQRTPKAFELKFQNISAVLSEEGYDWMPGLKPMSNVQQLLRAEVEQFMADNPGVASTENQSR